MELPHGDLGLRLGGPPPGALLDRAGHHVYGVDISAEKVRAIAEGRSPVVEPGVEELLQAGVRVGRPQDGPTLEPPVGSPELAEVFDGTPPPAPGKLHPSPPLTLARGIG